MKNKNLLRIFAIIIPVVLIGIMIYLFVGFQKKKEKVEALKSIPAFSVNDINGNSVTQNDIPEGNKILVYFNPECEYCQMEMAELSQINDKYKDISWIMFTDKSLDEIRKFAEAYHLDKAENIIWCNDPGSKVYMAFGIASIPSFLGYNAENKLVHRSTGAKKIEKVIGDFDEK